jgi:hypothetical protein
MYMCTCIHKRKLPTNSHIIKAENILQKFFTPGTVKIWLHQIPCSTQHSTMTVWIQRAQCDEGEYTACMCCVYSPNLWSHINPISCVTQFGPGLDPAGSLQPSQLLLRFPELQDWRTLRWVHLLKPSACSAKSSHVCQWNNDCKTFLQFSTLLPSLRSCQ